MRADRGDLVYWPGFHTITSTAQNNPASFSKDKLSKKIIQSVILIVHPISSEPVRSDFGGRDGRNVGSLSTLCPYCRPCRGLYHRRNRQPSLLPAFKISATGRLILNAFALMRPFGAAPCLLSAFSTVTHLRAVSPFS